MPMVYNWLTAQYIRIRQGLYLGRFLRLDLIKWVSNVRPSVMSVRSSVRASVRPQKSFFDFKEIWYVGKVQIDDWRYAVWPDPRSRSRSWALESRKFGHFQRLSPPPFITGVVKWPRLLKVGQYLKIIGPDFFYFWPSFCVTWRWSWQ